MDAPELGQPGGMAWERRLWRWRGYSAEQDPGVFFSRESWEAIVSPELSGDVRGAVWRQNIRSGPFIFEANHWSNLGPTFV